MLPGAVVHLPPSLWLLHSLLEGGAGAPSSIDIIAGACLIHDNRRPLRTALDIGRKPVHEASKGMVFAKGAMVKVGFLPFLVRLKPELVDAREAVW